MELIGTVQTVNNILRLVFDPRIFQGNREFAGTEPLRQKKIQIVGKPVAKPAPVERGAATKLRQRKLSGTIPAAELPPDPYFFLFSPSFLTCSPF